MRKKISEVNIFPDFDLYTEYKKIEYLISEKHIIGDHDRFGHRRSPQFTLEDYINQLCFNNWNLRGTFLSIGEMRLSLGIEKEQINGINIDAKLVLDFLQYAANCTFRVALTIRRCSSAYIADENYITVLIDNMNALLNRLGARFSTDEETSEVFVIYNDDLSAVVADDHPEISNSIIEYKKIDNRGDLKRKGEILCTLFKRLEEDEKKFKGTTYEKLCSDTTFLFNKCGARHWVEKDKIASKTFSKMSNEELEKWYDKTYVLFLSCMVISQYLELKKEIEDIKRIE